MSLFDESGIPARVYRKNPAPLRLGAFEWWTTGWFDETPEENGITLSGSDVTSWIGKIRGYDYAQATGSNRPSWSESDDKFACPQVFFDKSVQEWLELEHNNDFNFMHNGTGGTIVLVFAPEDISSNTVMWSNGGSLNSTSRGCVMDFLATTPACRIVVTKGAGSGIYVTNHDDSYVSAGGGTKAGGDSTVVFGCMYITGSAYTFHDGGVQIQSAAELNAPSAGNPTYATSYLGKSGNNAGFFDGYVTDLILFDRNISEEEMKEILAWGRKRIKEE